MGEHEPLYSWRTGLPLHLASTGKPTFGAPDDCRCCRCPCVMEEPGLTVERSGLCAGTNDWLDTMAGWFAGFLAWLESGEVWEDRDVVWYERGLDIHNGGRGWYDDASGFPWGDGAGWYAEGGVWFDDLLTWLESAPAWLDRDAEWYGEGTDLYDEGIAWLAEGSDWYEPAGWWFDQIDYWEASHGFGDGGTAPWPWCEIQWTGYQSGEPPAPIAWCYLFHNRQTGQWFAFIDVPPGVGGFGWAGGPYGTNVTGLVACEGGQIAGAFDLAGENGYEGCTASCVIG